MRLDRLIPGSRFMTRNMRRTFAGALAISTGESFIGASSTYSSRGCQSASAAGSLKPQWNWAPYLRPSGSHFEVRHAGASAISGAVKYLVQVRLVERGREPGTRHDFCRIHDHTWSHYISQSDPVLSRIQAGADEGTALLGLDSPVGRRLDETRRFFAFLREEIKQSMAKWQRLQAAEREAS